MYGGGQMNAPPPNTLTWPCGWVAILRMNKIRVEICKCLTQGSNSIPLETQARRSCSLISNAGGSAASYIYKGENRRNFYLSFSGSPESVWLLTGRGNTCISSALYYSTELDIVSYLVDYNQVRHSALGLWYMAKYVTFLPMLPNSLPLSELLIFSEVVELGHILCHRSRSALRL